MSYILTLLLLAATTANAGDLRLDVYGGVYHFDRDKMRGGKPLHEDPKLKGVSYSEQFEHVRGTIGYMNFTNSIRQDTHAVYIAADGSLYSNGKFDAGCGLMVGSFIKGYSIPFYGAPYCYTEYDRVKFTVTGVPTIGNRVDGSIQWKVDVKLWEF